MLLDGGDLRPSDVPDVARAQPAIPLDGACVVINACEGGLPGVGAMRFYQALGSGETVGAAALAARRAIRTYNEWNPTGLAYAVYASPLARLAGRAPTARGGDR